MSRRYSKSESDKWHHVYYVTDAPRRRDFLWVLLGRWTPVVRREESVTSAWFNRELKRVWGDPKLMDQFYDENPWFDLIQAQAVPEPEGGAASGRD